MTKVNSLLNERLQKGKSPSKMAKMAEQSVNGNRSSFSGIFQAVELSSTEAEALEEILLYFRKSEKNLSKDLTSLTNITSEIKAINAQAAILHGERIQRAQEILKTYKDGAFTSWMIAIYGNRQTPYNFLQYYEFYKKSPPKLRPQIEKMPRQGIYTLASREGPWKEKISLVKSYNGETKSQLLQLIRERFPLSEKDLRMQNRGELIISTLNRAVSLSQKKRPRISSAQKEVIQELLQLLAESM